MKAKKKLLSLLLAAAMMMTLLPTAAFATETMDPVDGVEDTVPMTPLTPAEPAPAEEPEEEVPAEVPENRAGGTYTVTVTNNDSANVTVTGNENQTVTVGEAMTAIKLTADTKGNRIDPTKVIITGTGVTNTNGGITGTPTSDVTITIAADAAVAGRVLIWSPRSAYLASARLKPLYQEFGCTVTVQTPNGMTQPFESAMHFTGSEALADKYDLVIIDTPNVDFDDNDKTVLNNFLLAGGRVVMIGEIPSYFATGNSYLSALAGKMGAAFTITNNNVEDYVTIPNSETNANSDLSADAPTLMHGGAAVIKCTGASQWVAKEKTTGKVWIVDQAAGTPDAYGRITAISDKNFCDDDKAGDYKEFLKNLLDNSIGNKTSVGAGEDPNTGFGAVERNVNVTLTNATVTPAILNSVPDNTAVSYDITADAGYELPATVAASGGLTYTRTTATTATISGTVTGNVTMAVTAAAPVAKYVSATGNDTGGNGTFAQPYKTLTAAYAAVPTGGEIRVLSDLTVTAVTKINTANKTVTIQSYSDATTPKTESPWTITRGFGPIKSDSSSGTEDCIFLVESSHLTLKNIIIDGSKGNSAFVGGATRHIYIKGAATAADAAKSTVHLESGSVLQNGKSSMTGTAVLAGFSGSFGTLYVHDGAKIINNDNSAATSRSNVIESQCGDVYLLGGEISGNTLANISAVGAIVMMTDGKLHVSGNPKVTDNKTTVDALANVYLDGRTILVDGALTSGANIGVALKTMPDVNAKTKEIAVKGGSYSIQDSDAAYFHSDKSTAAGVRLDGTSGTAAAKVVLDYDARFIVNTDVTLDASGDASITIDPTTEGAHYAVLDKNGVAVVTSVTGATSPTATNSWYTADANGEMTFNGLDPAEGPYQVVTSNSNATAPATSSGSLTNGTAVGGLVQFLYVAGVAGEGFAAGNDTSGDGSRATPYATIGKAYTEITTGNTGVIVVLNVLTQANVTLGTANQVVITGETAATIPTVTRSTTTGAVFNLTAGTLSLQNITISGGGAGKQNLTNTPSPLFEVGGASTVLNINTGAKLCDNWWSYDGTSASPSAAGGGAVRAYIGNGAVINMTGGEISGNKATYGAGVLLHQTATFNMSGGEIKGNSTTYNSVSYGGAGVYLWVKGTFNMTGGKITGNTSIGDAKGGGVALYSANSVFHMSGGEISGNKAATSSGIGVLASGAQVTFSGKPVVKDNLDKNDAVNNLYLMTGATVKVSGELEEGARIGVYLETQPSVGTPVVTVATGKNYHIVESDIYAFWADVLTSAGVAYQEGAGDAAAVVLDYNKRTSATPAIDGKTGDGTVTVTPTKPGMVYSILDETGKVPSDVKAYDQAGNEIVATDKGWYHNPADPGTIVFKPTIPGGKYEIVSVTKAVGETVTAESKKDTGNEVTVPSVGGNVSADKKADGTFDVIINPASAKVKYAIVDPATGELISGTTWKIAENGKVVFSGLAAGTKYEIVAVPIGTENPVAPAPGTGTGITTPAADLEDVDPGSIGRLPGTPDGANEKDKIVLNPTKANQEYGVRDPITGDVTWQPGTGENGADVVFDGLDPNKEYDVITRTPGDDTVVPLTKPSLPSEGITVPTMPDSLDTDHISGSVDTKGDDDAANDEATITIKPTDPNLDYGIVDKDGNPVPAPNNVWKPGTENGSISFPGLKPGEDYKVVTKPKGDAKPANPGDAIGGLPVTAPEDLSGKISGDKIEREENKTGPDAGKDKITVENPGADYEIGIRDPETGDITWQPGTGAAGDLPKLTFSSLDPNKEYDVVVRPADENKVTVPALPGTHVKKLGEVEASGIVKDAAGNPVAGAEVKVTVATVDGGYKTITVKTDANGKYTIKGDNVKLPGDYAIYVSSDKGCQTSVQNLGSAQPQKLADITTDAATTNIVGGTVSSFGEPVVGQTIKVVDKTTGLALVPQPTGGVLTTTDGGGYVLENLPDGTYVIETSGGTPHTSGMTEVVVKDGKIVPNTDGGYKSTNIAATPGYFIKGQIQTIGSDETATVTINVPLFDTDGVTIIGSKLVTSITKGEGGGGFYGYYQLPSVPNGTYTVTASTSKGQIGTKIITVNKADVTWNIVVTAPADPAKPGVITGVAVDKDGEPVKNATVTIYDDKGNKVNITPAITTGEGGGYSVTGLPNGNYYISVDTGAPDSKNGLTGPVKVTGTKTEGKTAVTVSESASKLLEGTVTDSNGNLVTNTDVVVRNGAGYVIATPKTNSYGQYYVGGLGVANALVVTATGETGGVLVGSATTADGAWKGDITTTKSAAGTLTVIGPDGGILNIGMGAAIPGKAGITVATKAEPPVDATAKFETDGKGNLKAKAGTEAGTYVVTIKNTNGMTVTKEITVDGSENITTPSPFKIAAITVTGKVTYAVGSVPSDVTISIPGFGSAKVNTNTGEYQFTGVPDGVYTATIIVKDKNGSNTTITATLTVKDGKAEYSNPGTGAEVGTPKTNLTIKPTAPVAAVNTKIDAAKEAITAATATPPTGTKEQAITAVKDALEEIGKLTDEGRKQLDPDAVKELSKALTDLMSDLHVTAGVDTKAEGVTNTGAVQGALENQKGLLVDAKELDIAATAGKSVDVTLTLKAKDATNDPTPAVQKDMNKVQALATAKNAEKVGYYDVTVEKTTVVKENNTPVSTTVTSVPELPTPVELKLSIPAELRGYQYYGVVRVHQNGSAERLPSISDGTTVTFKSALYSTFAILASNDPIFEDDTKVPTGGDNGGTGGGGSTSTGVTVPKHPGGTVTVNPTNPGKGEDFIITVTPDKGYVLDKLTVKDPKGNELTVTPMGGGKYKVTMPDPAVKLTVDATFKKLTNDPHSNGVSDLLNVDDHIAYMKGRAGGKFAPADNMTRAEVAQMFYNLLKTQDTDLGNKASYNDVPADAWYAKAVNTLANIGVVNGVGSGSFAPDRTITRAEFIAIAARFADATTGGDTFSDVPATHWAYKEITTATAYGWIGGYGDGSFKPGNNIARSEAVKVVNAMLARSADKTAVDAAEELITFSDVPKTDWAYYPIVEATNAHDFELKDGVETWKSK